VYIELSCSCSAAIQIDVEKSREEAAWLFVNRFANAHVSCGFILPLLEELPIGTSTLNITVNDQDN